MSWHPLLWILVEQGPVLGVGADGGCLGIFLSSIISLFLLPLSGKWPNIDRNTVSKDHQTQNNHPTTSPFEHLPVAGDNTCM